MFDRRQFIQSCLSALAGMSLTSPAQAWPLANPPLHPFASCEEPLPSAVENSFVTTVPTIKVFGIGGSGGNAASHMIDSGVSGMEFIFANTNTDDLNRFAAHKTIQLHRKTLRANTKRGRCRETAEFAANDIRAALAGTHLLFITVGMGGGTGTETAPVIARIAKEMGIKTVALATMPFSWEGARRSHYAEIGLAELKSRADTVIVLPNDKLVEVLGEDVAMNDAFDHVNEVMKNSVIGIVQNLHA